MLNILRSVPDSRFTCRCGWLCLTATGADSLGPGEVCCPSIGGCWSGGSGECGWLGEYSHTGKWEEEGSCGMGACGGKTVKKYNT